jgi:hypothetical protein
MTMLRKSHGRTGDGESSDAGEKNILHAKLLMQDGAKMDMQKPAINLQFGHSTCSYEDVIHLKMYSFSLID